MSEQEATAVNGEANGEVTPQLSPIDKIMQASRSKRRKVYVEDWDVTLWFGPMTSRDWIEVDSRLKNEEGMEPEKHRLERYIMMLILKAENEDGTKAFSWGDRIFLRDRADFILIQRLVVEMFKTALDIKEAKKNLSETDISVLGSI